MSKRKLGATTSGIETSPRRKRRDAKRRRAQEAAWAAKAGPVTVTCVDPETLRDDTQRWCR
jgi:hypothetical protein